MDMDMDMHIERCGHDEHEHGDEDGEQERKWDCPDSSITMGPSGDVRDAHNSRAGRNYMLMLIASLHHHHVHSRSLDGLMPL